MPRARFIHALLVAMGLVVAPWIAGWHAAADLAKAESPASCCAPDGSCCCGNEGNLPPACPCCPVPVAPKPSGPITSLASVAAINSTAHIARPRTQSQPSPRDQRRESSARHAAQRDSRVANQSWPTPSSNVRLWTCVHQT